MQFVVLLTFEIFQAHFMRLWWFEETFVGLMMEPVASLRTICSVEYSSNFEIVKVRTSAVFATWIFLAVLEVNLLSGSSMIFSDSSTNQLHEGTFVELWSTSLIVRVSRRLHWTPWMTQFYGFYRILNSAEWGCYTSCLFSLRASD